METNLKLRQEVIKPSFLIDKQKVLANITEMAKKAEVNKLTFRPHFKTHQSAEIGRWFLDAGAKQIIVSSVDMAYYFAGYGWRNITIAIPVNLLEIPRINELAAQNVQLNLLVDSEEAINCLIDKIQYPVNVWIKIDTGARRSGIPAESTDAISSLAVIIAKSKRLSFEGILTHFGNSYSAKGADGIYIVYKNGTEKLFKVKEAIGKAGLNCKISIGDTPCCSTINSFPGIDEIRPGNFVFYDLMQYNIGACPFEKIAAAIACPVIGKYPERGEFVVFGGAVHFSKDYIIDADGNKVYAQAVSFGSNGWSGFIPGVYAGSLSQEHGIIKAPADFLRNIRIGDVVYFIPAHSCLTADLFNYYLTLEGEVIPKMVKSAAP
ncbi:MAG TPA: alanine racemase [Ignavibacteriales bacterium]|nr:alanine racemase [Ignavibacteriales bacterium]